jgi:hypothetical protein
MLGNGLHVTPSCLPRPLTTAFPFPFAGAVDELYSFAFMSLTRDGINRHIW